MKNKLTLAIASTLIAGCALIATALPAQNLLVAQAGDTARIVIEDKCTDVSNEQNGCKTDARRSTPIPTKTAQVSKTPQASVTPRPSKTPAPTITANTAGRLLASNCFQCHGTDGKSVADIDSINGGNAREIISELQEMSASAIGNNIMKAHAREYTAEEVRLIAEYLATR